MDEGDLLGERLQADGRPDAAQDVFTRRELDQLFAACDRLEAKAPAVMPVLLPVLFRLLCGCGLRVSEALNLTRGDVDLDNCCLTVRHAKFDQDRLVPLSSSMADIMRRSSEDPDSRPKGHGHDSRPSMQQSRDRSSRQPCQDRPLQNDIHR
jgi:integrase